METTNGEGMINEKSQKVVEGLSINTSEAKLCTSNIQQATPEISSTGSIGVLLDSCTKTDNDNEIKEPEGEDDEMENMKDVGLGSFVDSFKDNLIQHVKDDRKQQNIERLTNEHYNPDEERERKEALLESLMKENSSSMGLPETFVSKKEKIINLKRPKNLMRLQNYYGDIENEPFLESKAPNPALMSDLGKNEYFCKLCDARCNGLQSFEAHMKGSKHFKKMKKLKETNMLKSLQMANDELFSYFNVDNGKRPSSAVPKVAPQKHDNKLNINLLLRSIEKPLIGLQYLVEYVYDGNLNELRYICEMCEKRCDDHTIEAHVTSYAHRWSYIKLRYPHYADDIREYGPKKQDRLEAIEDYAARIESEEDYPRKINKSTVVNANRIVSVEEALIKSGTDTSNLSNLMRQTRDESNIGSWQSQYRDHDLKSSGSYQTKGKTLGDDVPQTSNYSRMDQYEEDDTEPNRKNYHDYNYKNEHRSRRENVGREHRDRAYHKPSRSPMSQKTSGLYRGNRVRSRSSSMSPTLMKKRLEQYESYEREQQHNVQGVNEYRQKGENANYEQPNLQAGSGNTLSADDIQLFKLWKENFLSTLNPAPSYPETSPQCMQGVPQYPAIPNQRRTDQFDQYQKVITNYQNLPGNQVFPNHPAGHNFVQQRFPMAQNYGSNLPLNNSDASLYNADPMSSQQSMNFGLPRPYLGRMKMPTSLPQFGGIKSANNAVSDKVDAYINNIMRRNRK